MKTWFSSTALILILGISVAIAAGAEGTDSDFSHYEVILARMPFGEPPPPPPTPAPTPPAPPPPSFINDLKLTAITERGDKVRVGFVNTKSNPPQSYFLYIGESEDGIEVVDADYDAEGALLRKDSEESWIYMDGRPVGPAHYQAPSVSPRPAGISDQQRVSYAERLKQRRVANSIRHRTVEPPKLSGKELEDHLKNYQMECIRKGMPPLPIPLTKEMDDQLVAEGVLPPQEE